MKLIYGVKNLIQKDNRDENVYYLGYNFKNKKYLIDAGFDVFDTRELISNTAHEIKFDFINYIAEIGKKQRCRLKWWASKIASKSNLQTDFFANTCLLYVCAKILEENNSGIIVTDDVRVYFLLKKNFEFQIPERTKLFARKDLLLLIGNALGTFLIKRMSFIAKRIVYNYTANKYFVNRNESSVFLYSWVEDRSFNKVNDKYNDPYFPNIDKYINKEIVYFCPYYAKTSLIKRLANNSKIDGLSNYTSFLKLILSSFYLFLPKNIVPFNKYNLNSLWRFEVLFENKGSSYISHIHDYFAWKSFFSINRGNLIYPFENQPWEKVMILANDKEKVKLFGAMHTTIHKLLLPFHTTDKELEYMPLPGWIITNSAVAQKMYEAYFEKTEVKIILGGSLRFNNNKMALKKKFDRPVIGVMLSCIVSQTKEQLEDLFANANGQFNYLVKRHPDLNVEIEETSNIRIFDGNAVELYQNVQAIAYCSSTCGIEAYAYGLPVFRLRTQYLDLETGENSFSPFVINTIGDLNIEVLKFHPPQSVFSKIDEGIWTRVLNIEDNE